MKIDRYFARIGYDGPRTPTTTTLQAIHRAHLLSVPFEALDTVLGKVSTTSRQDAYDKIVERRRGGFCFEMNGLFSWVLEELGFEVTLLSARPIIGDGELAPPFAHLALMVQLEERWLADVGFGFSFLDPLRLDHTGEQRSGPRAYRVSEDGHGWWMHDLSHDPPGGFAFDLEPRALSDFEEMCHFYSTDAASPFVTSAVWAQATEDGWLTISKQKVIEQHGDQKTEREIDEAEWKALVSEHAGVHL